MCAPLSLSSSEFLTSCFTLVQSISPVRFTGQPYGFNACAKNIGYGVEKETLGLEWSLCWAREARDKAGYWPARSMWAVSMVVVSRVSLSCCSFAIVVVVVIVSVVVMLSFPVISTAHNLQEDPFLKLGELCQTTLNTSPRQLPYVYADDAKCKGMRAWCNLGDP